MNYSLGPEEAWDPLPASAWDAAAAKHLLRRVCWTAVPDQAAYALRIGLPATLGDLFPNQAPVLREPDEVAQYGRGLPSDIERARSAAPAERRQIQRETRERGQRALQELAVRWLAYAADPACSSYAKWVLFLSNLYVVGADKVQDPDLIFRHFDILGRYGLAPAPLLAKAVLRSPAMMIYLDINQNRREAPNENFAREFFELFSLGIGHYTEHDIKESARALTGYRYDRMTDEVLFIERQHDWGPKTIFGETGDFDGDSMIDLTFKQRAAGARVPQKMVEFYLSDTPLPDEYLYALGDRWRTEGAYSLDWLVKRFFGSRLFFAPEFRGEFIKSPAQYYLGLIQDLRLNVIPLPRFVVYPMRQMGQALFYPPNVRGWVGGHHWIDSATLSARRTVVELLFTPLDEGRLNADEQAVLASAHAAGTDRFEVDDLRLQAFADAAPAEAVARLQDEFLPLSLEPGLASALEAYLAASGNDTGARLQRVRRAAITVFESPVYQLC